MSKKYVEVHGRFMPDGKILPTSVVYDNGKEYFIDKITDIRPAASLKAGGAGIRYTVNIGRATTFIFLENDKWFVNSKNEE